MIDRILDRLDARADNAVLVAIDVFLVFTVFVVAGWLLCEGIPWVMS